MSRVPSGFPDHRDLYWRGSQIPRESLVTPRSTGFQARVHPEERSLGHHDVIETEQNLGKGTLSKPTRASSPRATFPDEYDLTSPSTGNSPRPRGQPLP